MITQLVISKHYNVSATIGSLHQELNCHCSLDGMSSPRHLVSSDNSVPEEGHRSWSCNVDVSRNYQLRNHKYCLNNIPPT